jgi:hypothetical protein
MRSSYSISGTLRIPPTDGPHLSLRRSPTRWRTRESRPHTSGAACRDRRGDFAWRAAGTPWKVLERRFGYCRTRLWMLLRAAESVYEHQAASQGEPNE